MKISAAMKAHLVKHFGLSPEATDEEAKVLLEAKKASGEITPAQFIQIETAKQIDDALAPVNSTLEAILAKLNAAPVAPVVVPEAKKEVGFTADDIDAAVTKALDKAKEASKSQDPFEVFKATGALDAHAHTRVKSAVERYSRTKSNVIHAKGEYSGQQVLWDGRPMETKSQADTAMIGAFAKKQVLGMNRLNDHEKGLVLHLVHEEKWTGFEGAEDGQSRININGDKLSQGQINKALLDDATSGGLEAAPIVFDDAIIQTAILTGQLFPHVNVMNLDRGRRVEAFAMGRPTIGATAEGTAITLETTTSYITALDTTIFNAVGSMEIGLDFEADTPNNIGERVTQNFAEAVKYWLDNQIANGDGTTEPTGIFVASGTTSVSSANGTAGPLTWGDFEALFFGLTKAERSLPGGSYAFIGNDTMYRRARAIPRGPDDAQRLNGNKLSEYLANGERFLVQNDIAAGKIAYANLKRYRMYKRLGTTLRYVTDGQTLALKNTGLLVVRARFGGQPELGSAFAVMTDGATS